jgi:actin-like protein 6A
VRRLRAVAAVQDGYVLQKSITRSPMGGELLSRCMLSSVEARGAKVVPRHAFKRVEKAPGQWEVRPRDGSV